MASIAVPLRHGLDAIRVARTRVVGSADRMEVDDLDARLTAALRHFEEGVHEVDDDVADQIKHHADQVRGAIRAGDIHGALRHGRALIGALPGDPQSKQKPPWKR